MRLNGRGCEISFDRRKVWFVWIGFVVCSEWIFRRSNNENLHLTSNVKQSPLQSAICRAYLTFGYS